MKRCADDITDSCLCAAEAIIPHSSKRHVFRKKIRMAHAHTNYNNAAVQAATADATPPVFTYPAQSSGILFSCFKPISLEEVVVAVWRLPNKSSAVDPLLVNLLKKVVTELAPYLTKLFNL